MALKNLVAFYGRFGLIVAAFALVAGIIGGPLLQKFWFSHEVVADQGDQSAPHVPKSQVVITAKKQG